MGKNKNNKQKGDQPQSGGQPQQQARPPPGQSQPQQHPPPGQQQAQRGPPPGQQAQRGPPQGQQAQRGPPQGQQAQRGPPPGQSQGPNQPYQQRGGPQQGQGGRPQGQYQQGQGGRPQGQYEQGQGGRPQGQHQQGQGGRPQGQYQQGQGGRPQGQYQQGQGGRPQGQYHQGPKQEWKPRDQDQRSQLSPAMSTTSISSAAGFAEDRPKGPDMEKAECNTHKNDSVTLKKLFRMQKLEANFLPIEIKGLPDIIIHYDVTFTPDRPKKMLRDGFKNFIAKYFKNFEFQIAFDGSKSAFAKSRLMEKGKEFEDKITVIPRDGGRPKEFVIKLKEAKDEKGKEVDGAEIDMRVLKQFPNYKSNTSLMRAIQALDVVLRTASDKPGLIRFKRSIFAPPKEIVKMPDNYELWVGLFQSFIMGSNPYLNVDVSHKAFPGGCQMLDLYNQCLASQRDRYNAMDFHAITKGLNVMYKSPFGDGSTMEYKLNSVKGPASKETFIDEADNKKRKTIQEYFAGKGKPLRYPDLPVCHVGSTVRNILLPIEHLLLPGGQALNRKAPDSCTRDMVRYAATSTDIRKGKIMNLVKTMDYNRTETLKQFGLVVGEKFKEIDSHILNDRTITYKNSSQRVQNGAWRAERDTFISIGEAEGWAILNLNRSTNMNTLSNFANMICRIGKDHGMNFNINNCQIESSQDRKEFIEKWLTNFKQDGVKIVFVVIPNFGEAYYDVKKIAEHKVGILTQCVKAGTVEKKGNDPATINNILLKDNAKLGGTSHFVEPDPKVKVAFQGRPWMVIGADVTHPSPQETTIPSVVGVAASSDKYGQRYNCQWRLQDPRDEMIRDLEEIVRSQISIFKETHKVFPQMILYYRDGVSDGQFDEVTRVELRAMQKACASLGMQNTKIIFIVVQKRHHTRFFPVSLKNPKDRNNNVVPGTVVDHEIVNPLVKTFYLVSHQSIQGVAKPTKYVVIHEDENIPSEQLQVFTFGLCHQFARCNRIVSYPAPTYYAHLVAYRGRVYIHNERLDLTKLQWEYSKRAVKSEILGGTPMFFI